MTRASACQAGVIPGIADAVFEKEYRAEGTGMTDEPSETGGQETPGQDKAGFPLFYSNPVPVSLERHRHQRLRLRTDARFAQHTNAVPVNLEEFAQVSRHYPIAFIAGKTPFPVAILGMRSGENMFLDGDGRWMEGVYIPAYVRRYPFILSSEEKGETLTLCIDEADGVLSESEGPRFFDEEGNPSEQAKAALSFCQAYHRAVGPTELFAAALQERGLLVERQANVAKKDGQKVNLTGFHLVDSEKLAALGKDEIADWWGKGWLQAVTAHQISMLNWGPLADRC